MKKDFEIRIVAKNATLEIRKGMGVGVLLTQEVTLTLPDEITDDIKTDISFQLVRMGQDLMDEEFKIQAFGVEELKAEGGYKQLIGDDAEEHY